MTKLEQAIAYKDAIDTIEALQQENEQLRAKLEKRRVNDGRKIHY